MTRNDHHDKVVRWPVMAALLLAVIALTVTNVVSLQALSAVRAYVSGESLWSKGQKDATFGLLRYSETRDPADFAEFEKGLSIPLGDRIARHALDAAAPDRVVAAKGFVQGGNQPEDAEAMVDLFLRFRHVGFMARAITIWEEADAELDRLIVISAQLRDAASAGLPTPEFQELRERIRAANARLTLVERRFSDSLGDASRSAQRIVSALTVALAALLAVTAGWVIRRVFKRIATGQQSLLDSDERWGIAAQAAKAELFEWDLSTDVVTSFGGGGTETAQYGEFLASLPEADRSRLENAMAHARTTRTRFSIDQRLHEPDGTEHWINVLGQFSFDAGGKPYRMLGVRVDVTDRKVIETRLRRWQQRYEATIKASRQILYDWNANDDQMTFAGDVEGILGYQAPELAGVLARWVELVHIDDRPRVAAELERVGQNGGSVEGLEYRIRRKDGAWITVAHDGHYLQRVHGESPHLVGFVSNISERMRIQAALMESEQRYRMLWTTAPDAVVVLDETGRIDYANASVTQTFGWESEALVGQSIEVLQPERLRTAHRTGMARYLKTGHRTVDWRATEAVGLHRDGHEFALEVSFSHTRVNGKQVFAGFLRDVEARKQAEAERARLADFVEKSLIEIYVFDPATLRLEYGNAAARDNLGRSSAELCSLTAADLAPEFGIERYRALLAPLQSGMEKLVSYEAQHVRADGSCYPAQVTVQAVGPTERRVLLAMALDVTERVAGNAARQLLLEQLRQSQKMESLGTLAGGIAHDFNNIVGSMLGNIALARHDIKPGHPARESIDQINRAALRARELVSQILAFSRQQAPRLVDQALQPIVFETLELLRASLPASVTITLDMPDEPVFVRADSTQIEQVLLNLCTNAWRASKGGESRIQIGVAKRVVARDDHRLTDGLPAGAYAHVWVTDNGDGMDAATRARIFEPFFTTRPVGEGTGLGLSVVHGIVTSHDGAIVVESEVGRGTTVHVYLSLQKAGHGAEVEAPATVSGVFGGGGAHLLYIDDDELMLLMVERLLQRAGYQVTAVQDAEAALALLRHDPYRFDLVLSDLNMPRMSGLQVARAVMQLRPDLPIVIISGDGSHELSDEATELGVAALVHKQNTLDELPGVIRRLFGADDSGERSRVNNPNRRSQVSLTTPIPREEIRRLERLRELAVLDTHPEPVFDAIVKLASEICGAPIALLTLVDQDRQWFKANVGLTGTTETPRDIAFCAHAIMDDPVFVVPDATLDLRFAENPLVTGPPKIRFYAGAPLVLPGGERVGTLCVMGPQERTLGDEQIRRLQALAEIATQTLMMRRDLMRGTSSNSAKVATPA